MGTFCLVIPPWSNPTRGGTLLFALDTLMDSFHTRTKFFFLEQISDPPWLFVNKLWTQTRLQHPQISTVDLNLLNWSYESHSLERKYLMCGTCDANLPYLKRLKPASSFKHFRNTTRMSEAWMTPLHLFLLINLSLTVSPFFLNLHSQFLSRLPLSVSPC